MPPPRLLRPLAGLQKRQSLYTVNRSSTCFLCSISGARYTSRNLGLHRALRRSYSTNPSPYTSAPPPPTSTPANPRTELEQALLDIKKHAANYVNLSRLHLALLGLRQPAGEESIRVAVLGVASGPDAGRDPAREVLRLLLADPLKGEQGWEKQLAERRPGSPVVVKIGSRSAEGQDANNGVIARKSMFEEIHVSSPGYDGYNLELLLMDVNLPSGGAVAEMEEALLDLPVDIASNTGKYSPIMTPVHKALLVSHGITGATSIASLPANEQQSAIFTSVDIPGYQPRDDPNLPFQTVDVGLASKGVGLIREDLSHAMDYERLWFQSNIPALSAWLKTGIAPDPGTTKAAVRMLIASVLQNTLAAAAEASKVNSTPSAAPAPAPSRLALQGDVARWAENAHAELQEQLDLAFTGRRWRKLNWWKLFWRVDDVGVLTNDMLAQRFLPTAEKNLVFLAGQIKGASPSSAGLAYSQPGDETRDETRWPTHISFTRRYLQNETIPALQALAQKLVVEALGTTGLTGSLAALLYVSQYASNLYEAGAVAALGAVWSLRRLQRKWEAARGFWEGEVREEGRKAVRGAEESVAETLEGNRPGAEDSAGKEEELARVRELVAKAEDALRHME